MPSPFAGVWWHRVRGGLSAGPGCSDAELLGRYAAAADPDAFAGLVHRHGPTVLGVCRRVLGDGPDADDAFQATFLVLVRRAKDVRDPSRLAGWLFGVAYRTAREARSVRSARWRRETLSGTVPDRPVADPPPAEPSAVDAELAGLSEKYRAAVVLCDLEGLTRPAAAARLGIPEGTLSSRLAAARRLLADRLVRRDVTLTAAGSLAAVPDRLVAAVLADQVPASVTALTRRVEKVMTRSNHVFASLVALAAVGGVALGLAAAGPPPVGPAVSVLVSAVAAEDPYDLGKVPPVVVKTIPEAGAAEVDPKTKEVRVTFSKEMTDKSWSWATDPRYGLELPSNGAVAYDKDKKSCVLPVKLEPGKTYAVWLNTEKFENFKDAGGRAAVPYLLVFSTAKK